MILTDLAFVWAIRRSKTGVSGNKVMHPESDENYIQNSKTSDSRDLLKQKFKVRRKFRTKLLENFWIASTKKCII